VSKKPKQRAVWVLDGVSYDSQAELVMATHLKELKLVFYPHFRFCTERQFKSDFCLPWIENENRWWPTISILIEVDGGLHIKSGHSTASGIQRDMHKQNEAAIRGFLPLRFSAEEVETGEAKKFIEKRLLRGFA
jgi:hypothetical protein